MKKQLQKDRLPPHSMEAEQGVIGCMLLGGGRAIAEVRAVAGDAGEAFYSLQHRTIYGTLCGLEREGLPVDPIVLTQRLKDTGNLEGCGGMQYVLACENATPSAANLEYYLNIVGEKWALRRLLGLCTTSQERVYEYAGSVDGLLAEFGDQLLQLTASRRSSAEAPKHLREPREFLEDFYKQFFGGLLGPPGWELPLQFGLRIRAGETTLVTGDDGSGKSTMLSYWVLHLAQQLALLQPASQTTSEVWEKCLVASFEVASSRTLWGLASQLMGRSKIQEDEAGKKQIRKALAWLTNRFLMWDYLGIGNWRELLTAFRFAAEKRGVRLFVLDSVMRIGIADDDYAQQGFAATAFAQFCKDTDSHLFFVIHENKGKEGGKSKIRGSKLWSANADNVIRIERNVKKGEQLDDLKNELSQAQKDGDESEVKGIEKLLDKKVREWDSHIVLQKQRYPGSQQNASKFIFFDGGSFQFRAHWEDKPVDYLSRWQGQQ